MKAPIILKGTIIHGKALGRTVGMPTANLLVEQGEIPTPGVYATKIIIDEEKFYGVTNIGQRPTIDQESDISIETFIIDFERDIYNEYITLEVHKYLRPIRTFSNLQAVKEQVEKDVKEAKKYLDML